LGAGGALARRHWMLAINIVCADTDAEARRLFTTQQQAFVNLRRGRPGLVPPPLASAEDLDTFCSPMEKAGIEQALACSAVGSPSTVAAWVSAFVERHQPDELIVTANVFDPDARLRSYALAMDALKR